MLVGIGAIHMAPWHSRPPEAATSVTCTCSEQQSFSEPPTVCKPCARGCRGVYSQPPPPGSRAYGEGSPVSGLADGVTGRVGRALDGEPRGWNSPWQATRNQRENFENNSHYNSTDFHFLST